jgi:hypothetical protein
MIEEKEIIFVTTTLYTECLELQKNIIKRLFPESEYHAIDGKDVSKWPNSFFYWMEAVKKSSAKYFIHIDEDCFIVDKEEIMKAVSMLVDRYDIIGCPDGYHPARESNPIAMNPFIMLGKTSIIKEMDIDMSVLRYTLDFDKYRWLGCYNWTNSAGFKFKHSFKDTFFYPHPIIGEFSFQDGKEPYYGFFWYLKERFYRFGYLYPHFDSDLKSTNPRIDSLSKDMAIHMWESRNMDSDKEFYGLTAKQRFENIKIYLKEKGIV